MFQIGLVLHLKREERGWTQLELVKKTGISQPNLSDLEKGKQDMTLTTFLKICRALAVRPGEVLDAAVCPRRKPFLRCTRREVERIAKAVVHGGVRLDPRERVIAGKLKVLVPGETKRRFPDREIYRTWIELRRTLTDSEIKILTERVRDELARHP